MMEKIDPWIGYAQKSPWQISIFVLYRNGEKMTNMCKQLKCVEDQAVGTTVGKYMYAVFAQCDMTSMSLYH